MVTVRFAVHEYSQFSVGVADDDVGVAVVVDVAECCSPPDVRDLEHRAGAARDVLEAAGAQVPVQLRRHLERERIVRPGEGFDGGDAAVGDEQIQPAVAIEIQPAGAEAGLREAGRAEAGGSAPILEVSRAVVEVQHIHLVEPVRDEQILVAVVVEVARVNAHARFGLSGAAHGGAGEERRVLERAVVLVDPELVGLAVVGDVEIDPPVVVEVGGG